MWMVSWGPLMLKTGNTATEFSLLSSQPSSALSTPLSSLFTFYGLWATTVSQNPLKLLHLLAILPFPLPPTLSSPVVEEWKARYWPPVSSVFFTELHKK